MSRDYDVKVVEKEVLSKNRKALYINGTGNILEESGILSLEQKYPQSIFIISPHLNCFHEKSAELEQRLASWPKPSLALVKGTWLGEMDGSLTVGVLNQNSERDKPFSPYEGKKLEDLVDAFLYLGPVDSLTGCGAPPDTYQDEAYVNELNRRWRLIEGQDLSPEFFTRRTSNSWRYIEPFQEILGNFSLSAGD